MMIAVANACMAEKGALKSMLKRFSSTLPIRKQTSLSLAFGASWTFLHEGSEAAAVEVEDVHVARRVPLWLPVLELEQPALLAALEQRLEPLRVMPRLHALEAAVAVHLGQDHRHGAWVAV
eukprot:CAMPEP_0202791296 /NCGR_PEP_ID=MMETSP1388-20130828/81257_1 /ASSEMBLY_ACC=CAM_ASM_000864 /TAXON_ID=37098 /ORGANISM="Isochrysis sp, Strain CCMP1244" /LENGTH=120 /DNA_ID=CAMNT_0049461057 /DNA_START=287 /DNA_END=645 /DNA_ORIENTATION=-